MSDKKTITRREMVELLKSGKADLAVMRAAAMMLEQDKMVYDDLKLRNAGLRYANSEMKRQLEIKISRWNDD